MKFSIGSIIGISIALFVASIVLPLALTEFVGISTGNASVDTILTTLIPVVAAISIVAGLVKQSDMND